MKNQDIAFYLNAVAMLILGIAIGISIAVMVGGCEVVPYHFERTDGGYHDGMDSDSNSDNGTGTSDDSDTSTETETNTETSTYDTDSGNDTSSDGDTDTDTDSVIDGGTDTESDTDTGSETDTDCFAEGLWFEGSCWYLTPEKMSCDQMCGALGLDYDLATCGFAMDASNCDDLLIGIGVPEYPFYECECPGMGCHVLNETRGVSDTCDSESSAEQSSRICACEG